MTFTHHSQVINYLIQKFGYKSYLEIGVHKPAGCFDQVRCQSKIGVDPNGLAPFTGTSDEFFQNFNNKFDIIFIDGLHHYDQVRRDFDNALSALNDGGLILIHDTNPPNEAVTVVPRNGLKGKWCGDVYKLLFDLHKENVDFRTIDFDGNGLTIVRPGNDNLYKKEWADDNYDTFNTHRVEVANLVTQQHFEAWI